MSSRVRIYTTRRCGYCFAAKALLDAKGIPYEEIDVTGDDAKRAWLRSATGRHTVPQVFIDEVSQGGFTELAGLARRGDLDALVAG